METETREPAVLTEPTIEIDDTPDTSEGDAPPIFGRCPVCYKPLFPRDRFTGEPKAPPPGTGYESRARCGGCGAILCYMGNGKWRVLGADDLGDDDRQADQFDRMMGFEGS
ncbi:MAG: hypothetical protein IT208_09920 [Chthonomonadales bacterium]|nr:hypothetical protein [Chthonomonadales bacterium]